MRYFFLVIVLICGLVPATSQSGEALTAADSDPEAKQLLDKMEAFIASMETYKATFQMTVIVPGSEELNYQGLVDQMGDKYYIETTGYKIFCDGKARWVLLEEDQEANIYDVDADGAPTTPLEYLTMYKDEEFVYRLADEYAGRDERAIEFKPLDKYSDYTKLRLTLTSADHSPSQLELFEKGGVRTTLKLLTLEKATPFPDEHFVFDASKYPDVHVEDLRID